MKHLSFIEKSITNRLMGCIMSGKTSVSVWDGEEWMLKKETNRDKVKDIIGDTDQTQMRIHDMDGNYLGWIMLVHGNDWDMICDYSVELESMLKPVNDWVDENCY